MNTEDRIAALVCLFVWAAFTFAGIRLMYWWSAKRYWQHRNRRVGR